VAEKFAEFPAQVHAVRHGDTFSAAGFDVHVYGERHAIIHRDIPAIANTGYRVDGQVFHPGDALTVPEDPVTTLLLPVNAPWLKAGEFIDYFREVGPAQGYAIHDGMLNDFGLTVLNNWLAAAAAPIEATLTRLPPGGTVDL
jgi:hypothetical protein